MGIKLLDYYYQITTSLFFYVCWAIYDEGLISGMSHGNKIAHLYGIITCIVVSIILTYFVNKCVEPKETKLLPRTQYLDLTKKTNKLYIGDPYDDIFNSNQMLFGLQRDIKNLNSNIELIKNDINVLSGKPSDLIPTTLKNLI